MRRSILAATVLAAFLPVQQPAAQDSLMDFVLRSCDTDIKQYCSQVTPGEGRLLYCAAAHEDKLSGRCSYALYQAASLLEQFATAVAHVATECKADIEALCGDVKAGEGRILSCLEEKKAQVGDSCKQAVADAAGD